MMRLALLVQACPHEHVIKYALLAFQSPQGATLHQSRRDGIELTPAVEATVRLEDSF
jgi:hypothetical protein